LAKDYAAKQKPQPEPVVQSKVPRWVWLFTSAITGSFLFLLVYLSNMTESEQIPELSTVTQAISKSLPDPQPIDKTEQAKEIEQQVEQTQQALSFYKLLTEQQVKIAPPPTDSGSEGSNQNYAYLLQAASFRNESDAESLRAQLILSGIQDTNVESVSITGKGTFYRVLIGPIINRSDMNAIKDTLVDIDISPIERRITLTDRQ